MRTQRSLESVDTLSFAGRALRSIGSNKRPSDAELKLTDLSPLTLGRIAALVSLGKPLDIAYFQFQVRCAGAELCRLQPLRETCCALRNAAHLAVGGLHVDFYKGDMEILRKNEAGPSQWIA